MYAGTTLRNSSGKLIGAHQKLDRVARKALESVIPDVDFPNSKEILHFEGRNGPDGIKLKSPAQDEPWHYMDPENPKDRDLVKHIERHSKNLTAALKTGAREKAAFEAAWLAHALVDGLTPAHHHGLESKLEEMRGEGLETRTSLRDKLIVRSKEDNTVQVIAKNWTYWGPKGVMTSHGLYEWGFASIIAPLRLKKGYPSDEQCAEVLEKGIVELFLHEAQRIKSMDMFNRYIKKGWTGKLARQTRGDLAPTMVRIVALAWYEAAKKAGM